MSCTRKFRDELHDRGLRVTPQREAILAALHHFHSPVSAEEISREVSRSNPGIPMSTVYRTLDLLRSFGLVSVMESSGRGKLYLHDAAEKLHLHCVNCGRTLSLDPEDMAELLAGMKTRFGFEIDIRRLSLTGRCSACH